MFKNKFFRLLSTAILLCLPLLAGAQPRGEKVTTAGTVVDQTGLPVIGASVIEAGTSNGVVTDMDGKFSLSVKRGAILQISCIGYVSQDVQEGPSLSIVLQEDNEMLEETVVIGYGVQKKSSLTGAISQVKSEDLENRTITTLQEGLQGKTAGVQFISTGSEPGATGSIRIRGISSNASTEPLYVVDGVRVNDISGIDPNNIESMEVLKDAASAAIYGAEAGNGVVLVSTKKGKKGNGHITYDFQYTLQSLSQKPELLNAAQYKEYMLEAGTLTESRINEVWDGKTDTDWIDTIFETGHMQKHTLSLTGGNERGNYFLSLGYSDNNGILVGNNDTYKRLTAAINAEYKITDWLTVGTTNNISRTEKLNQTTNEANGNLLISALTYEPFVSPTYTEAGMTDYMKNLIAQGHNLLQDANGNYYGISSIQNACANPLILANNKRQESDGFGINGSIYGNLTPFKGLVVTSRFGYRLSAGNARNVSFPYYGYGSSEQMYLGMQSRTSNVVYYQWENFANYTHTWNNAHTINAMAGFSFQENKTNFTKGELTPGSESALKNDASNFWYLAYASNSAVKSVDGEALRTAKMSWFGRLGYEYKNKYMVQATLRADAADTSYLPATNRWGFFPSVSAGWSISEEDFFAPVKSVVNHLKIRASWGRNGSLASLGNYEYAATIIPYYSYPLVSGGATVMGQYPNALGNDQLKWETSEQVDLGLDARLFNDRLTIGIDWFDKETRDLLVSGVVPSLSVGGTLSPINAGNVSNKGFEFELGWKDNIGDFSYGISGNLATLKNVVTYVDPSLDFIAGTTRGRTALTAFQEGYPVYYFRGYKYAGVNEADGSPLFYDKNGNVTATPHDDDITYVGDAIPDFTYGVTINMAWKGFDFLVFANGSQGNQNYLLLDEFNTSGNKLKKVFYDDRWTPTNHAGTKPALTTAGNLASTYNNSDARVFDASYFKINQIQLGYSLPKNLLKKIFLSRARIYCSLDDFVIFTKYPGYSPDAAASAVKGVGIDYGSYPASKKVVFGINVEF